MANTVEGYVPDALAVKVGLKEINDSLGTVKFSTCSFNGSIASGELVYSHNKVKYVIVGNLLFYELRVTITDVITHPEGEAYIEVIIPELKNRNTDTDNTSSFTVGYANGGYKRSVRRLVQGNIANTSSGIRIALRLLRAYDDTNTDTVYPELIAAKFVTDKNLIHKTNNAVHFIEDDDVVNATILGSGVAILVN